jgi:hypothetical protein
MVARDDAMLDALDRLRGAGFEFAGHLSNHGPMVADALVELGVPEIAPAWCDAYRQRLGEAPLPTDPIGPQETDWRNALGEFRRVADWTEYFQRQLTEASWEDILRNWWPRLSPGIAAAGAHGLLRTAHAVRALDRQSEPRPDALLLEEFAKGLGYWAARYQPIPGTPRLDGPNDAAAALATVPRISPSASAPGRGIMGHLCMTDQLPTFTQSIDNYGPPGDVSEALSDLTAAGAQVLSQRMDIPVVFTHLVTAPSAVRFVLPHLPEYQHKATLANIWKLIAAIVASFPPSNTITKLPTSERISTDFLIDNAVGHGDEHVIKLSEAGTRENTLRKNPLYAQTTWDSIRHLKPFRWY